MNALSKICVFCGSRDGSDAQITAAAITLGLAFADRGITLIYGAAKIGVMGSIAQTILDKNGNVVGVIPQFLKVKEVVQEGLTELHITENMHQRKLMMQELSDGFIALPGGFGTLEELFEVLTWQQLGLHEKPIGLLNVNGFYDELIAMLKTMVEREFLSKENFKLLQVDVTVSGLLKKMEDFKAPGVPNWLKPERT